MRKEEGGAGEAEDQRGADGQRRRPGEEEQKDHAQREREREERQHRTAEARSGERDPEARDH